MLDFDAARQAMMNARGRAIDNADINVAYQSELQRQHAEALAQVHALYAPIVEAVGELQRRRDTACGCLSKGADIAANREALALVLALPLPERPDAEA